MLFLERSYLAWFRALSFSGVSGLICPLSVFDLLFSCFFFGYFFAVGLLSDLLFSSLRLFSSVFLQSWMVCLLFSV